jgi:hypothetical protein
MGLLTSAATVQRATVGQSDALRFALIVFVGTIVCGCSEQSVARVPTAPDLPANGSPAAPVNSAAWLWAMVVDDTGVCIAGASVEVVRGQDLGHRITQTMQCDAWTYDGGVVFKDLTVGSEMTLRATASGYAAQERAVVPTGGAQMAVLFTPVRIE